LGVDGKKVLLTFGLLSPDKGVEHVIDALPAILERNPETVYIVLGATHPHVKERHGETYRLMLEARALRLGVDGHMIFHNRFVSQGELTEFLSAADIYITPYLKPEQITSGTLAYAVGSGKAVISTPYWYASELLADGRGLLVPWRDPQAIAHAVDGLLSDEPARLAMCERAAAYGRDMLWPAVARSYVGSFERAHREHEQRLRNGFSAQTLARRPLELPALDLQHLRMLTDDTGILQHATFTVPRYDDGYCLDDNARALLLTTLVEDAGTEEVDGVRRLSARYLAFVSHAFAAGSGRFRNFMTYGRRWSEERGSEDSHGRALWALGSVVGRSIHPGRHSLGGQLFGAALPAVAGFTSPRAWAFALLGVDEYLRAFGGDRAVQQVRKATAERLLDLYRRSSSSDWPWFESSVTYSNARLSQALLVSGSRMENEAMCAAGLRSLDWLFAIQSLPVGTFAPIGSIGFYRRGETRARFDQQPVEACGMVSAALEAHRITGDRRWRDRARVAFNWFVGDNELHQSLYDPATGGCRDGLHADHVNENQGAESTLSFLLALLDMRAADRADAIHFTSGKRQ
ncbi:MAG: pimA 3, partial [Solirubrobacterales bacterium]|nr:pimA 3 [Solirubrobacterales bacterium]